MDGETSVREHKCLVLDLFTSSQNMWFIHSQIKGVIMYINSLHHQPTAVPCAGINN
jgi:hypothetical protein